MARSNATKSPLVRTQFLIFTLFGDYVVPREGRIWTSSLIYLMELLGQNESAVRSTLSRMSQKGWIKASKHGRRSQYSITPRGRLLLEEGQRRIFESIYSDWDGTWHLVLYSLPERQRRKRHALRTKLLWLGFGRLGPGAWISAHNRQNELHSIISDLSLESCVDMFSGAHLGPHPVQELVLRCWDLEGLTKQYQGFVDRNQPEYLGCLKQIDERQPLEPEEYFTRRFWFTHEFQSFPLKDPNLPTQLLSPDWIGFTARELFDNYRQLLGSYTEKFIDEVICGDGLSSFRRLRP